MAERILIVDDDPLLCSLLRMALVREGYDTREFMSGNDALDFLAGDDEVDLVLLDVMMADINGFEVVRRLREQPRRTQVPVIFLTARVDSISQQAGIAAGANEYLTKPITPDVLVERVRAVLDRGA